MEHNYFLMPRSSVMKSSVKYKFQFEGKIITAAFQRIRTFRDKEQETIKLNGIGNYS